MSQLSRALVVPCYNEALRLPIEELRALASGDPALHLFLVDDGSTDGTFEIFERAREELGHDRVTAHRMARNSGKAEAVRTGMRESLARGAVIVGYADADFATPAREILRLLSLLETGPHQVVLASRVLRLGTDIRRSPSRHLLGRIFATLASRALDANVYDTQCGAKWFRAGPALTHALETPFGSPWVFDVELLGRLLGRSGDTPHLDESAFLEVPIRAWKDVSGSKLRFPSMANSLAELGRLWLKRQ